MKVTLHCATGPEVYSVDELIQYAKKQEETTPGRYHATITGDTGIKEATPGGGWLVYNTAADGAGVVFKKGPNKYILITGSQSDFIFI